MQIWKGRQMGSANRTEKLDIRLTATAKRTLQQAALAAHRSVSDFVLESALSRAESTLPDRRAFDLDADQWAEFQAALDAPTRHTPRLSALLNEPSVFEQDQD
jgi:uncharacterized protein (DUF1778 family)